MNKWQLDHAIHRGTLMSRDVANSEEYDTEEEAMKALNDHRTFYRSIGYVIWWAYLTSPDGNKQLIEQNSNYR